MPLVLRRAHSSDRGGEGY
jgi:hypothetical protein